MLIGKIIQGRYRLYDQLSGGSASAVYLARDQGTGRILVVKVLYPEMVADRLVSRFMREIEVLQQAVSPHVVEIYDYSINYVQPDITAPISFIAMEYVEGLTLKTIIQRLNTLTPENTMALAIQLASALDALHQVNVVHRDIKSQNVMITAANVAKIIDFGIAKQLVAAEGLTGKFSFAGTLSYASPEQLKDSRNVDIRSDLYSLGVVLAECLLGKVPPRNRSGQHILIDEDHVGTASMKPTLANSHLVSGIVERLLSAEPANRYETPAELLRVLSQQFGDAHLHLPWSVLGQQIASTTRAAPGTVSVNARTMLVTERGERIAVDRREFVIGRSAPGDDAWLPDLDVANLDVSNTKTVSRFHCRLLLDDDGVCQVIDMGSFNGTWLNGEKLAPRVPRKLADGDHLNLGGVQFLFRSEATQTRAVHTAELNPHS